MKKTAFDQPKQPRAVKEDLVFCGKHPDAEANWRCIECGGAFCENCVRVMKFILQESAASCPVCKNRCIDVKFQEEKFRDLDAKEQRERRLQFKRYAGFFILSVPFVYGVITWCHCTFLNDLTLLLCMVGAYIFGPLRELEVRYKVVSLILFVPALIPINLAASFSEPGSLMAFVFTSPIRYIFLSLMIYLFFLPIEKTAHFISRIYRA